MKEQYYQTMWEPNNKETVEIPAEEAFAKTDEDQQPYSYSDFPEERQERVQQMFWLHDRGLILTLPPEATKKIAHGVNNGGIPKDELQRLKIIGRDTILKNRYPTSVEGSEYMESVDMEWREHLFSVAQETADHIKEQAEKMGKEKIAIVLFGSVAKGLTKSPDHSDPSNIDMVVIGDFLDEEKEELFDKVRPIRNEKAEEIGNTVGVHIQDRSIFTKNNHNDALNYIASGATALYDPHAVWSNIESEALSASEGMKKYQSITSARVKNDSGILFEQKTINGGEPIVIFRRIPVSAGVEK